MDISDDRTRTGSRGSRLACALVGAALLAWPPVATAQAPDAADRLARAYPEDVVRGVEETLERAEGLGLPPGPLADKALEGAAKGVPGDRLLRALERRLEGLRTASDALPAGADEASLRAGADALGQGLAPDDLRRVGEMASGADRPAALVVLGELSRLGVPVDRALASVGRALERGPGDESVLALGQQVREAVRAGEGPTAALERAGAGPFGPGFPGRGRAGELFGDGPPGPAGPPVPPGAGPPGEVPGQGPPGEVPGGPPDGP